ncbi:MAG: hypothetical protein A7316_04275 [Candidatus Altiarchaeales archaeon WOR_SM1_86-2]|nr:MAG: hypothetical protein A7316_04275 [Candidatus Altiarchaeales archaeon WOR_SM1_86-2]ODS39156.1 MAG: hypothetical protein A7315_11475 [Candidatus Altiarchaeales archaeon WOR_SM1_79]
MPELLSRVEYASIGFPTKIKVIGTRITKKKHFAPEQMLGALENWFRGKSSVEWIRDVRESEEL